MSLLVDSHPSNIYTKPKSGISLLCKQTLLSISLLCKQILLLALQSGICLSLKEYRYN